MMESAHVQMVSEARTVLLQVGIRPCLFAVLQADIYLVCGALSDGKDRPQRSGEYCDCKDGWTGINCNVCTQNKACNAMMPAGEEGGVCYQNGEVVTQNYQMCDVTNVKIVEILEGRRPQVTFTCNAEDDTCDFQC